MENRLSGKAIRDFRIKTDPEVTDVWICKCGTKSMEKEVYKFFSHVQALHTVDPIRIRKIMDEKNMFILRLKITSQNPYFT